MSTTRQWIELSCGLHPFVIDQPESDPESVRWSSAKMDRQFLGSPEQHLRFVEHTTMMPTENIKFCAYYKDIAQTVAAPDADRLIKQQLENVFMKNVLNLGLKWLDLIEYTSLSICMQLHQCCPLDPSVRIVIKTCNFAPHVEVTTAMFCAHQQDWLRLHGNLAFLQIKEEFVSSYAEYEPFLKQIKELDDHAYVYEADSDAVSVLTAPQPMRRTYFSPKRIVRKLLLQVRPGEEITAVFTIQGHIGTKGCCLVVEAAFPADAVPFVRKWKERENMWSTSLTLRENIEAVLGVDLAAARAAKIVHNSKDADTGESTLGPECAICFSNQVVTMNKKRKQGDSADKQLLPSSYERHTTVDESSYVSCLNLKCDKLYHAECAKNWLKSLPSARKSFGTLFGKCPYCDNALEVQEQ